MELFKTVTSPFRKVFAFFTEEIPHKKNDKKKLTPLGYLLYQEKLKEKRMLEEQMKHQNK